MHFKKQTQLLSRIFLCGNPQTSGIAHTIALNLSQILKELELEGLMYFLYCFPISVREKCELSVAVM